MKASSSVLVTRKAQCSIGIGATLIVRNRIGFEDMSSHATQAHNPSQNNATRGIREGGKILDFARNFFLIFNTTKSDRKKDNASAISA
jgi:hypothetical protein